MPLSLPPSLAAALCVFSARLVLRACAVVLNTKTQVDCEDCGEKKDARMRTCLEHLPNLLIVHLKRFELDYSTFETVKLNDRCSFPMVLDVKPYTMKGIDQRREERA